MSKFAWRQIIYFILVTGLAAVPFFSFVSATTTVTTTQNITVSVSVYGPPVCGDGFLQPPEECDDGNLINEDGCSDQCLLEAVCGDGNISVGEQCDDGNTVAGDGCSDSCQLEAVATPTSGWSGGKKLADIDFYGLTSPQAFVRLLRNGKIAATTQADKHGDFYFNLKALEAGVYIFGFYANDRYERKTLTISFSLGLSPWTKTTVENIFLMPTISIARDELIRGQKLLVAGETYPQSRVQLWLGIDEPQVEVFSDQNGFWQALLDTSDIGVGPYAVKAQAVSPGGLISNFSENIFFEVIPSPIPGLCAGPDLNFDGLVDIYDLSILLFYWQETKPDNVCADINRDGIVNIIDFSIMLYWWSETF